MERPVPFDLGGLVMFTFYDVPSKLFVARFSHFLAFKVQIFLFSPDISPQRCRIGFYLIDSSA